MRLLLPIILIIVLLPTAAIPASACTGPYTPPFESIARYDLIVAATVMDVDDVGIGTILKVDRYFKGAGGEYLAVMPYPPALQYAGYIRRYDTGCLYAARTEASWNGWQKHDFGYVGLMARGDGTYKRSPFYSPHDAMVEFYSVNAGDYGDMVTLSVADFEQLLLEIGEQTETTEPQSNPYPLMRFLNITTATGQRYRLNPDRSLTWLDPERYPIAISNDGSHVMFRLDDNELAFQYLSLVKKPFDPLRHALGSAAPVGGRALSGGQMSFADWLHPVPGRYAQFSPNSDAVVVQEETRLRIYFFVAVPIQGAAVGFAHNMQLWESASADFNWPGTAERLPLAWSGDSKSIAFQDSRGAWLWNIFDEAGPQLVLEADADQELLDLSHSGRYLRYGARASWTLLDVQSGETWQNTLISPDESRLIQIRDEFANEEARSSHIYGTYQACNAPLSRCPLTIVAAPPRFIFWNEPGFVGLVFETRLENFPWKHSHSHLLACHCCCPGTISSSELPPVAAFAFDPTYMQPAFAYEETRIGFKLRSLSLNYDRVDLSEYLDSPIVDLEWGQPIFYRESPHQEFKGALG